MEYEEIPTAYLDGISYRERLRRRRTATVLNQTVEIYMEMFEGATVSSDESKKAAQNFIKELCAVICDFN